MTDAIEMGELKKEVQVLRDANSKAIEFALRFGGIDGAHHKAWVIDQMLRVLCGGGYEAAVRDACAGTYGPSTYSWDVGIAP